LIASWTMVKILPVAAPSPYNPSITLPVPTPKTRLPFGVNPTLRSASSRSSRRARCCTLHHSPLAPDARVPHTNTVALACHPVITPGHPMVTGTGPGPAGPGPTVALSVPAVKAGNQCPPWTGPPWCPGTSGWIGRYFMADHDNSCPTPRGPGHVPMPVLGDPFVTAADPLLFGSGTHPAGVDPSVLMQAPTPNPMARYPDPTTPARPWGAGGWRVWMLMGDDPDLLPVSRNPNLVAVSRGLLPFVIARDPAVLALGPHPACLHPAIALAFPLPVTRDQRPVRTRSARVSYARYGTGQAVFPHGCLRPAP
jgi:hypothetical protein